LEGICKGVVHLSLWFDKFSVFHFDVVFFSGELEEILEEQEVFDILCDFRGK